MLQGCESMMWQNSAGKCGNDEEIFRLSDSFIWLWKKLEWQEMDKVFKDNE